MLALDSEAIAGLIAVGVVAALLAANYIAVTIQDRRAGTPPKAGPEASIVWEAVADPTLRRQLDEGRTIEAIKTYRELTGVGLKEAKDIIDFVRARPGLLDPPAPAP